jgi:signal transduction histidine kinase
VQEALTNVGRHARANSVRVSLGLTAGGLALSIRDDGQGFDPETAQQAATHGSSLGLLAMHERAILVKGDLTILSAPGQGTEIRAVLPVGTEAVVP